MSRAPALDFLTREPMAVYRARAADHLTSHQLADFRKCPLLYHRKKLGLIPDQDRPAYRLARARAIPLPLHCEADPDDGRGGLFLGNQYRFGRNSWRHAIADCWRSPQCAIRGPARPLPSPAGSQGIRRCLQ